MRFAAFVLLCAAAPAAGSQAAGAEDASQVFQRCVGSLDPALTGLEAMQSACPGLEQALSDSGYLPFISPVQREQLRPDQLADLQDMLRRYATPVPSQGIEVATLDPILQSLREPQAERALTWMERLRNWLRGLMERRGNADSWVERWLQDVDLPSAVSKLLFYGSIILVVGLALVIVINELRVAGLLRRRGGNAGIGAGEGVRPAVAGQDGDASAAAHDERAPLLLRALVATLVRTGRLSGERSLTHRELGLRASFEEAGQRECFQRVAALAERVVYGGRDLPAGQFDDVLEAGRDLNAKLGGTVT